MNKTTNGTTERKLLEVTVYDKDIKKSSLVNSVISTGHLSGFEVMDWKHKRDSVVFSGGFKNLKEVTNKKTNSFVALLGHVFLKRLPQISVKTASKMLSDEGKVVVKTYHEDGISFISETYKSGKRILRKEVVKSFGYFKGNELVS